MRGIKIFLIISALFLQHASISQTDSLKKLYNQQTVYRYGGHFMKGGDKLTFKDLQKEFSFSSLATDEYMLSKKYKNLSIILRVASVAASIGSIISIGRQQQKLAFIFLGGQMILSIGAGKYSLLSAQYLDKAIWQRNKDLLFRSN